MAKKSLRSAVNVLNLNCITFYHGDQVGDSVLEKAVSLAIDGFITEAGRNLYLIPIKHHEKAIRDQQAKADEYARRRRKIETGFKSGPAGPSIKKWDCISLTSFLPKKVRRSRGRLCQTRASHPLIPRLPEGTTRNASTLVQVSAKGNGACASCGGSMGLKRKDAKYCSSACKQAAHRIRECV